MGSVLAEPKRPAVRPDPVAGRRPNMKRKQHVAAYLFVLPFFAIFVAMLVVPLLYSGYLSFFATKLIGGVRFVGFENYTKVLLDPKFLAGVGRVVLVLAIQMPIMLGLALLFALVLDSGLARGTRALRLLI